MAAPLFRCAQEVGFIPGPHGMVRVQLGQVFEFDGIHVRANGEEIVIEPGPWMDPVNDEAREMVAGLVKARKRKSVEAESKLNLEPVKPPKAGLSVGLPDRIEYADAAMSAPSLPAERRAAPRRRAAQAQG